MIDAREFYGLQAGSSPMHWSFVATPGLCSGIGALFGGAGLGAAILALEESTERPVVWATAQFLSFAKPDTAVDLEVHEVVRGHRTSQARVVARVGGEEIFTVNAATGQRDTPYDDTFATMPALPAPDACAPREIPDHLRNTILARLDTRMAKAREFQQLDGNRGDGRPALWVRLPDGLEVTAATLAIIGDYVPFGIGQSLGVPVGGNSLDNTIRIMHHAPRSKWILADVRIHSVANGFGHGAVLLWSEDGNLLANASQSVILRPFGAPASEERSR